MPEPSRQRSLRRRLTILDRLLSDGEAEILERITNCLVELSSTSGRALERVQVKTAYRERIPFSEQKRKDIGAVAYIMGKLPPCDRVTITQLAKLLDPSHSATTFLAGEGFVERVKAAASPALNLYQDWKKAPPHASTSMSAQNEGPSL